MIETPNKKRSEIIKSEQKNIWFIKFEAEDTNFDIKVEYSEQERIAHIEFQFRNNNTLHLNFKLENLPGRYIDLPDIDSLLNFLSTLNNKSFAKFIDNIQGNVFARFLELKVLPKINDMYRRFVPKAKINQPTLTCIEINTLDNKKVYIYVSDTKLLIEVEDKKFRYEVELGRLHEIVGYFQKVTLDEVKKLLDAEA